MSDEEESATAAHVGYDEIREMEPRFVEALKASGDFWVEAREYDSGIGLRLDVSDKRTGRWFVVIVEEDDE